MDKTVFVAALLFVAAPHAFADSYNSVTGRNGGLTSPPCGDGPDFVVQEFSAVAGSLSSNGAKCSANITAYAGDGAAGLVIGMGRSAGNDPDDNGADRISGSATMNYEIMIETPPEYSGGLVPFGYTADWSAMVQATVNTSAGSNRVAAVVLSAEAGFSARVSNFSTVVSSSGEIDLSATATASLGTDSDSTTRTVVAPTVMVNPNFPVTVGMTLSAVAVAENSADTTSFAFGQSLNSLTFTTSGPVFDLPPGFTVTSAEASIVDNVWIDTRSDDDSDDVPDLADNCLGQPNEAQRDTDGDGAGNLCDADLNNDCIVNATDLGLFKAVFFTSDPDADFDGDGIVNVVDLGILRALFFASPGPSGLPTACAG